MRQETLTKLRERLDQYSIGFPATDTGVEFKILEKLFSEEEAGLFLDMSPRLESPAELAARLGRPEEELSRRLGEMAGKGLLFRLAKDGQAKYAAIPFIHGLFEFQVKDLDRELAALVESYISQASFDQAMQTSAGAFLRPIPVGRSVAVEHHVAAYEDAAELLRQAGRIVVTECICRKQKATLDKGCGRLSEACFMFGSMGQYYLDRGMGRLVSLEEALSILAKAAEQGLVTQPGTAQNPAGMCNCCGDCCGVLASLNKHPQPAALVLSNHFARVDAELCTGCETCLERCQMAAIAMNGEDKAEVNLDRCIGCGLCVITCPTEALALVPKAQRLEPPRTSAEQMRFMAQRRGLI